MRTVGTGTGAEAKGALRSLSPRAGFAWTLAGNAIFAASQWAILSLIAKLGSGEMLGSYALALSIAFPIAMLSHLNLRTVVATDVKGRHSLGDYLRVRLLVAGAGVAVTAVFAAAAPRVWLETVIAGAYLAVDNVSDTYYGALQRRQRLDLVARSLIVRGAGSAAALGAVLAGTRSLVLALLAILLIRSAVLVVYDRRCGSWQEDLRTGPLRAHWEIFRTALPLGAVLMLISLNTNLPRYAVERYRGSAELGAFAAAASFVTIGGTAVNALGQATISVLARRYSVGDIGGFARLARRMFAIPLIAGLAGTVFAVFFGDAALSILYTAEFARYQGVLVAVLAAGTLIYLGSTAGYVATSLRQFAAQLPLFAAAATGCGAISWILVPHTGLYGAAAALAVSAAIQVTGNLLLVRRTLRARAGTRP